MTTLNLFSSATQDKTQVPKIEGPDTEKHCQTGSQSQRSARTIVCGGKLHDRVNAPQRIVLSLLADGQVKILAGSLVDTSVALRPDADGLALRLDMHLGTPLITSAQRPRESPHDNFPPPVNHFTPTVPSGA